MKRRTNTLAQQYRIRAEYAARKAEKALDDLAQRARLTWPQGITAGLNAAAREWLGQDQFTAKQH